jgi:minor extracellular serine protease Vpr
MRRLRSAMVLAAGLMLASSTAVAAAPQGSTDSYSAHAVFDKTSAIVTFKDQPVSTYDGHLNGYEKTRPSKGKLNPNSAAYKKYVGYLKQQHAAFQKWLQTNVPSAKVTSNYFVALNGVAVKLNGAAIGKLSNSTIVKSVDYVTLYHPTLSESYKIINASGAWSAAGGRSNAGSGIKIGDIDTGIDVNHPFFDPSGFSYPAGFPKCDATDSTSHTANTGCKYVSPKVIVAKVFNNKLNQNGFDAEAVQDHGTHTAGIAAGVTGKTAVVNGVSINDMSGIAPGAWLGNYNVFPGDVTDARNEDILNAVEAAVNDGMDVLNLSLGGGYHGNNDLLALGLDDAVAAGVVVAVAAGNSGPGGNTIESPGRARNVITVGASTNQHFVGQPVTYPAGGGTTVGGAVGDFDSFPTASYDLFDTNSTSCTSVAAGASGKVALINRGSCTFSQKIANAKAAGAVGVVVVNNVAGDPTAMARTAGFDDDIPAVMIGKNEGAALRTSGATTISFVATFQEFITPNGDILAGFSSQGPTTVDLNIKPDLTSVGVNVLSSISCVGKGAGCPGDGSGWAFFSGTSMATPHIAGSAAVLLDLHPGWTPAQIKSALVNRADIVVTDAFSGVHDVGPNQQGGGRENLGDAATSTLFLSPVAAAFGQISGSQQTPTRLSIRLTNPTGTSQTFSVSETRFTPSTFGGTISSIYGAGTLSSGDSRITTPTSVTVPANGTATLTVSVNPGLNGQTILGWINLDGPGSSDYHFAYSAYVP